MCTGREGKQHHTKEGEEKQHQPKGGGGECTSQPKGGKEGTTPHRRRGGEQHQPKGGGGRAAALKGRRAGKGGSSTQTREREAPPPQTKRREAPNGGGREPQPNRTKPPHYTKTNPPHTQTHHLHPPHSRFHSRVAFLRSHKHLRLAMADRKRAASGSYRTALGRWVAIARCDTPIFGVGRGVDSSTLRSRTGSRKKKGRKRKTKKRRKKTSSSCRSVRTGKSVTVDTVLTSVYAVYGAISYVEMDSRF